MNPTDAAKFGSIAVGGLYEGISTERIQAMAERVREAVMRSARASMGTATDLAMEKERPWDGQSFDQRRLRARSGHQDSAARPHMRS